MILICRAAKHYAELMEKGVVMNKNSIYIKGARAQFEEHGRYDTEDKFVVITGQAAQESPRWHLTRYMQRTKKICRVIIGICQTVPWSDGKTDVDYIDGLSPAISIDQKTTSKNPRSTVGTVTEIYDYRLLYAYGVPHCHICGKEITQQTVDQMVDAVAGLPEGTRIQLLAPVVRGRKGEYHKLIDDARKNGYVRIRIDGEVRDINEEITLDKNKKHTIEIVVDRLIVKPDMERGSPIPSRQYCI